MSSPTATRPFSRSARPATRGKGRFKTGRSSIRPHQYTSATCAPWFRLLPALVVDDAVADVADRLDEGVATVLELAAQAADVHVDGAGAAEVVVAPDALEQRLAREHLVRVLDEEAEQLVLLERQLDGAAGDRDAVVGKV